MFITSSSKDLKEFLEKKKQSGKSIGFVPTMGALHKGHLALVNCSILNNDLTCVSIFVNPAQFNNPDDLRQYPRMEKEDIGLLIKGGCDVVFIPDIKEMYPEEDKRMFDLGGLDEKMEGEFRKGHFNGVAQIVSKLFSLIKPNHAYFGRKDFQQLTIIEYLNDRYLRELGIRVVACNTVREPDGLAMSSRNLLLNPEQRNSAALISKTLFNLKITAMNRSVSEIKNEFINTIDTDQHLKTEYIEIVDNNTLNAVEHISPGQTTVCVAVFCGKVRLIDNLSF
jgi:pantoate--beta-alanine ligase